MAWEVPEKVEKTSGDIAIGVLVRCFFDFLLPLPCQTLVFGPISDKCLFGPGSAREAPGGALGGSGGALGELWEAQGQLWEALAELWEALGELWEGLKI